MRYMQAKDIVLGLPILKVFEINKVFEACQLGKKSKGTFPHDINIIKGVLQVVHIDVWDQTKNSSLGGSKYFTAFIIDYSRKLWVYFMKEKSKVFMHF